MVLGPLLHRWGTEVVDLGGGEELTCVSHQRETECDSPAGLMTLVHA